MPALCHTLRTTAPLICCCHAALPPNHEPHLVLRLQSTSNQSQCAHGILRLCCGIHSRCVREQCRLPRLVAFPFFAERGIRRKSNHLFDSSAVDSHDFTTPCIFFLSSRHPQHRWDLYFFCSFWWTTCAVSVSRAHVITVRSVQAPLTKQQSRLCNMFLVQVRFTV